MGSLGTVFSFTVTPKLPGTLKKSPRSPLVARIYNLAFFKIRSQDISIVTVPNNGLAQATNSAVKIWPRISAPAK